MAVFYVVMAIAIFTFVALGRNFFDLKNHDEGTDEMKDLAQIIRDGAKTFLTREYRVIIPAVAIVAVIYISFMEVVSGFTFILGALMSSCACLLGMGGGNVW
ncbi:sodium/proton-translocating pyrophosphatase [Candidatus Saccharibacteria bacterium]|nr:sodium/proton-translocating pyrophosphatase [Candidatus Saccharibacteria bacterium]